MWYGYRSWLQNVFGNNYRLLLNVAVRQNIHSIMFKVLTKQSRFFSDLGTTLQTGISGNSKCHRCLMRVKCATLIDPDLWCLSQVWNGCIFIVLQYKLWCPGYGSHLSPSTTLPHALFLSLQFTFVNSVSLTVRLLWMLKHTVCLCLSLLSVVAKNKWIRVKCCKYLLAINNPNHLNKSESINARHQGDAITSLDFLSAPAECWITFSRLKRLNWRDWTECGNHFSFSSGQKGCFKLQIFIVLTE